MSELKKSLEWAEEELGRVRKQLEEKQGMFKHCLALGTSEYVCLLKSICLYALGANVEYEALKKAVADAHEKAAAEQALHEKHEARVITAERELQEAVTKSESLEQSLVRK